MDSAIMGSYGNGPVNTPRRRNNYSLTPAVSASPTSRGTVPYRRSTTAVHDLAENAEDEDALSALPAGAHLNVPLQHDKQQPLPLKARSSFTSVRSAKNDGAPITLRRSARDSQSGSFSTTVVNLQHTQPTDADLNCGTSASAQNSTRPSISLTDLPRESSKMKKRPGLKKLFSFAPFSRQSVQAAIEAQQQAEAQMGAEQGTESPTTTVSKWMAMLDSQSEGRASVGTQSTSSSSFNGARIPNARKPTNSVNSRQSTADLLSSSSRTSSYTNASIKSGRQRASQRTPSPEMPQISRILTRQSVTKDTTTTQQPEQRAPSPTPTQHTRKTSASSIQGDAVICDAAVTTVLVRGRPKSVYGTHIMDMAEEPRSAAPVVVTRKPIAMSALRPRPKVLQLVKKTSSEDASLASPMSATSSMPSLYSSSSSASISPASSPATPATESSIVFAPSSTDSTSSWLAHGNRGAKAAPTKSFPIPPRTSSVLPPSTPPLTAEQPNTPPATSTGRPVSIESANSKQISLSPFTATALRTAFTRFPRTPPPPNPYTTPHAPFPSPSASTSSPYSSLYSSSSSTSSSPTSTSPSPSTPAAASPAPESSSYFRLPASSSAHPSLYPDLLAAKSTTVGMTLTREEAELIARMRVKRAKMRREELERLGRALGVDSL